MVAFNFQGQFVPKIESGEKLQTIRRSLRCGPGDAMQLYTGQRTKDCRLLAEKTCQLSAPVILTKDGLFVAMPSALRLLTVDEEERFARFDGFPDYATMYAWFLKQYGQEQFYGFVHRWLP